MVGLSFAVPRYEIILAVPSGRMRKRFSDRAR